ncbi:MAG: glycosyltransferase, partial [Flexibacteraceae bacterium]
MDKMLISVVSPVYRAENLLPKLVKRISEELEAITPHYEIILVEDSSPDRSWEIMQDLAKQYPKLKVVKLARNFGQQYALAAGLS